MQFQAEWTPITLPPLPSSLSFPTSRFPPPMKHRYLKQSALSRYIESYLPLLMIEVCSKQVEDIQFIQHFSSEALSWKPRPRQRTNPPSICQTKLLNSPA